MRKIKLRVMSSPPDRTVRTVWESASTDPHFRFFKGGGPYDLICGKCGYKLAARIEKGQVSGMVFKCPSCGSFNDTDEIGPN